MSLCPASFDNRSQAQRCFSWYFSKLFNLSPKTSYWMEIIKNINKPISDSWIWFWSNHPATHPPSRANFGNACSKTAEIIQFPTFSEMSKSCLSFSIQLRYCGRWEPKWSYLMSQKCSYYTFQSMFWQVRAVKSLTQIFTKAGIFYFGKNLNSYVSNTNAIRKYVCLSKKQPGHTPPNK